MRADHLRIRLLIEANMEELLRTTTFSAGELSLSLAVAGICGIVLGVDREIRGFAAGIRTHALISLSSALITIRRSAGVFFSLQLGRKTNNTSPSVRENRKTKLYLRATASI